MMSDVEEPPSKLSRIDMEAGSLEYDEGQEEWLSDELLTDDDCHTGDSQGNSNEDEIKQDISSTKNFVSNVSISADTTSDIQNRSQQDFEQSLNKRDTQVNTLEDLDAFLIRKTDGRVVDSKKNEGVATKESEMKSEVEDTTQDEDGNSTDDLLRMLGEDNEKEKKKKVVKKVSQRTVRDDSSDDDDNIFEHSRITRLRIAQTTLIKQQPAKMAEPEEMSDSNNTSDEINTMKKMFVSRQSKKPGNIQTNKGAAKSTPTPKNLPTNVTTKSLPTNATPKNIPSYVSHKSMTVRTTPKNQSFKYSPKIQINKDTPKKTLNSSNSLKLKEKIVNVKGQSNNTLKHLLEKVTPKSKLLKDPPKNFGNLNIKSKSTDEVRKMQYSFNYKPDMRNVSTSPKTQPQKNVADNTNPKVIKSESKYKTEELDEIIDEDEFLDDSNDYGLDELLEDSDDEEDEKSKQMMSKQRIMKPERMDEEVPSDMESLSEDGSMYDEIPSSDYDEEMDEWFTLDLRSERAGEYIPLLGPKAHQLLTDEKKRVTSRLATLKQSLSALNDSSRRQNEQLKKATATLAELDAMLIAI